MFLDILITILLVGLNAFFVAAEFALVKVRASQIELRVREGNRMAAIVRDIMKELDAYLSATQLGITLASLGLGWVGESVVTRLVLASIHSMGIEMNETLAHQIALPVSFALITIMHIVFGEQAPKWVAIQRAEGTSMAPLAMLCSRMKSSSCGLCTSCSLTCFIPNRRMITLVRIFSSQTNGLKT